MLPLLFGAVSLLYATVGQAGGTAFLAVMAFASFAPNEMRPTALLLNIAAATYSTWVFNRGSLVDWAKLRPLLVASLPTALVGGFIVLDEKIYNIVTGVVLLIAAVILLVRQKDGLRDRNDAVVGRNFCWCHSRFNLGADWRGRRRISRAGTDHTAMGFAETNFRALCAIHSCKFSGGPSWRNVCGTGARSRHMVICLGRISGRNDWNPNRTEMAFTNGHSIRLGGHPWERRNTVTDLASSRGNDMSAIGTKRTSARCAAHVRFWP